MNWQHTLNISSEWKAARENEITSQQLANFIWPRLELLKPFKEEWINEVKQDLIDEFKYFAEDENEFSNEDFDYLMNDLYNWADTPLDKNSKVCWIKTF